MSNFLFNSHFQKRYENGKLISVSHARYDFQNIPIGSGDKESLDNTVVSIRIQGKVSFDVVKENINSDTYYFKDRSKCIGVTYIFDNKDKKVKSIEFDRYDIKAKFIFLETDANEDVPKELIVEDISSWGEMCNVYPERTYSDDELEDKIDIYENRVETAQIYLEDEDDSTVRSLLTSSLDSYKQILRRLLIEKRRREL